MKKQLLLLSFATFIAFLAPAQKAEIQYIGNEGVLIVVGNKKVIIDGLHKYYGPSYSYPGYQETKDMLDGNGIFNKIDLLLVSHVHGDHFDAKLVAEFLARHPETELISSQQVVDSIQKYADPKILQRITHFYLDENVKTYEVSGITLTLFNLPHSSERFAWVQNIGNYLEIGDFHFLHTGDASMEPDWLKNIGMNNYPVDVALMPFWYLLDDQLTGIKTYANPQKYVALHIPPVDASEYKKSALEAWPGVIWFDSKGQKIVLED
jgi:L-ascorbate metabolism protein UlaG (beta-lactamase superfamily)